MIIQEKPIFALNDRKLFAAMLLTFTLGLFTLLALVCAALIGLAYLLNIVLDSFTEVVNHLTAIYTHSDSLVKLLMWCIALFLLVKISPFLTRVFRTSLHTFGIL